MSQEVASLVLPFSALSRDRKISFTKEMELAVVFYFAESDRKKGEGLLLRKPLEKLLFIAECDYPIWLVPWRGQTLLFDGLGGAQRTLTYDVLPDVKTFVNDIEGSVDKLEAYLATLTDHIRYFQSVARVDEKTMRGLITSSDFIEDFSAYLPESEKTESEKVTTVPLSPIVSEPSIASALNELSELKATLDTDTENLRYAMKLLNNTTRNHVDILQASIREVQKDFAEKIAVAKAAAMERIRQIQKRYDERITGASKRFEQQLQNVHKERVKLEKSENRALDRVDRCEAEIKEAKLRKDVTVQQRWKQEMENWKRDAGALQKSLEQVDRRISEVESEKKVEISNLRSEFNVQAENAMKHVRELEAARDARVQLSQQKIKSVEGSSSSIVAQIDSLIKQKRLALDELDRMGMRDNRRKTALAHVPLYLVCSQAEAARRYVVYPPSVAGTIGMLTKFKGMLGASRVKSLFQQRSKALANILNQLITVIERDPVFKRELHDVAANANILRRKETLEKIRDGLTELRKEEWIQENEFHALNSVLTMR